MVTGFLPFSAGDSGREHPGCGLQGDAGALIIAPGVGWTSESAVHRIPLIRAAGGVAARGFAHPGVLVLCAWLTVAAAPALAGVLAGAAPSIADLLASQGAVPADDRAPVSAAALIAPDLVAATAALGVQGPMAMGAPGSEPESAGRLPAAVPEASGADPGLAIRSLAFQADLAGLGGGPPPNALTTAARARRDPALDPVTGAPRVYLPDLGAAWSRAAVPVVGKRWWEVSPAAGGGVPTTPARSEPRR